MIGAARVSLGGLFLIAFCLSGITPSRAHAQDQKADTTIDEARLTAYAKAFAAIALARDSAHAAFALPRNKTNEVQRDLREKLHKEIDQILKAQGITAEQYAHITYVIATDENRRKSFEEILARLTAKPDAR
ncbi:MAG: hypothetical protein ACRENH_06315 [Gemmatimonadaceae bacterium]